MIKYRLSCINCKTSFDSWFSSSNEYERLKKKNFINCHNCNSLSVEKSLMTPSILMSKDKTNIDFQENKYKEIKKTISKYQKFIKDNFDYVGENFAHEARLIHYKDKKTSKGVYGSATKKDIEELKEEGIETEIVPWIKNDN
ncbi:DUF1178 family protein [Candidatus Pelagibacter sp.]|nr:DUF1178 family protein [Candidatus Pelagibacter sp.]